MGGLENGVLRGSPERFHSKNWSAREIFEADFRNVRFRPRADLNKGQGRGRIRWHITKSDGREDRLVDGLRCIRRLRHLRAGKEFSLKCCSLALSNRGRRPMADILANHSDYPSKRLLVSEKEAMKIRTILCAALLAACFPITGLCQQSGADLPIAVEATGVEKSGHNFYLDIRVWNCSSKELVMDITNLPWGGILTSKQVIYHPASGKVMQARYPVEDFSEAPYTIPAGGSISGKVDLGKYFHELTEIKHPDNWVVFWLYEPFGSKNIPVGKFGGMIPLDQPPRQLPGKSACHANGR